MKITLNGEIADLAPQIETLDDLLDHFAINKLRTALELNGQIIARYDYSSTQLKQGDCLEIVTFVGGG